MTAVFDTRDFYLHTKISVCFSFDSQIVLPRLQGLSARRHFSYLSITRPMKSDQYHPHENIPITWLIYSLGDHLQQLNASVKWKHSLTWLDPPSKKASVGTS